MPQSLTSGIVQGPPPPPTEDRWGDGGRGGRGQTRLVSFTGLLVAIASVAMVFVAFTSAFLSLRSTAEDWVRIPKPPVLWASTASLLLSSLVLDRSRHALRNRNRGRFNLWWTAATLLGILFLAGQAMAWFRLRELGIVLSSVPSASFFYLLSATHALHLIAGLIALIYVDVQAWRLRLGPAKRTAIDLAAVFWHFLTGVWLYLMFLFYLWG